jgi:hypothetical protein
MNLDELTDDLITTLTKFERLNMNKEAREYWTRSYQESREYFKTKNVHCIDCNSYEVANRKLNHFYNIVEQRGVENGQKYMEFSFK